MTRDDDHGTLRIWLVRHGRTLFNDLGRSQGWCDSPLTDDGVRGVGELARQLRRIEWTAAYSSTSERAVDTAELLVGDRVPLVRDRRWKEYNFGSWEAQFDIDTFAALAALSGADVSAADHRSVALGGIFRGDYPALPGGETGAEFVARVASAMADIRERHSSGDVLVVTHGMTIGAAAMLVDCGFDLTAGVPNASDTRVEFPAEGAPAISAYGMVTSE